MKIKCSPANAALDYVSCLLQLMSASIVFPVLFYWLQLLSKEGLTLLGILETHFHADFVSGHYEIGLKTGATIYYGPSARDRCKFPMHELKDNEVMMGCGKGRGEGGVEGGGCCKYQQEMHACFSRFI